MLIISQIFFILFVFSAIGSMIYLYKNGYDGCDIGILGSFVFGFVLTGGAIGALYLVFIFGFALFF
jgi:hypothetical protein